MESACVVLATASDEAEARRLSHALVERRLAACVNLVPGIQSEYWWQDKIETTSEILLIIKTRQERVEELIETVKQEHSYTVPEVLALPIVLGNPDYLEWLEKYT